MKNVFARLFTLAMLSVTVLTACQKEDLIKAPTHTARSNATCRRGPYSPLN